MRPLELEPPRARDGRPRPLTPALPGVGPEEVLARLVPGDPLGLRALVSARLRARALLVDLERALLWTYAWVALDAATRRTPDGEAWLLRRVDRALTRLLECGAEGAPPRASTGPRGRPAARAQLGAPLGLEVEELDLGCCRFHSLDQATRAAFFELVLEARPLDHAAHRHGLAAPVLARRARRALDALRGSAPPASHGRARPGPAPARTAPRARSPR